MRRALPADLITDPFGAVRARCAGVAARARSVRINGDALAAYADGLPLENLHHAGGTRLPDLGGDVDALAAYVLLLDAINFGSGWFPSLAKRPGCSGYLTIATHLKERFERQGPWSAAALQKLDAQEVTRTLGQQRAPSEVAALMELFAQALRELGVFLSEEYGGRFEGPLEAAAGRAEQLVVSLARMPRYADVAQYGEISVPFYKRAQITAADLALAFEGRGPGCFEDIDELTLFADNLVPHVLRMEGVLAYAPQLAAAFESGRLLPPGGEEEVEMSRINQFLVLLQHIEAA